MKKAKNKVPWVKPEIKELGEAKDMIKGLSPLFDSKNDLTPNDIHSANIISWNIFTKFTQRKFRQILKLPFWDPYVKIKIP